MAYGAPDLEAAAFLPALGLDVDLASRQLAQRFAVEQRSPVDVLFDPVAGGPYLAGVENVSEVELHGYDWSVE